MVLSARTITLHAKRNCPEYITTTIWPLTLQCAMAMHNELTVDENDDSPYAKLRVNRST